MAVDMSSEELRAHLFRSLKSKGVLDSVKSQLRSKLATELQETPKPDNLPPAPLPSSSPTSAVVRPNSMVLQVANSIIAQHLKSTGYEYSLSVFLPEAGIQMDKLFPPDELLRFLRINRSSPLHQSVKENQESGFLVGLLEGLSACSEMTTGMTCVAVQTDMETGEGMKRSVATKLQALEEVYAQKAEEENRRYQQSLEQKMAASQQESEAQLQRQLEAQMAQFREWEVSQMKLEEKERFQEKLARVRTELEGSYRQKLEAVRKMELETMERLRRKEQELDAGVYSQRQALLDKLEALKVQEAGLKRQVELSNLTASLEEERMRSMAEQLAAREKALQHFKEEYEQKAEEQVRRYKVDYDAEMETKRAKLAKWEVELGLKQEQLTSLWSECKRLEGEARGERERAEKLQGLLHKATAEQVSLQQQKDALQQKLEEVSGHRHLRHSIPELQQRVVSAERKLTDTKSELKKKLSDQHQLIRQLQAKLAQPSLEQVALQTELEQIRRKHHRELMITEYESQQLKEQLASQVEHSLQLQLQLEEQTLQLRSAQREVEDLHSQLEHLHMVFVHGRKQEMRQPTAKGGGGRRSKKAVVTVAPVEPVLFTPTLVSSSSSHLPQLPPRQVHHQPPALSMAHTDSGLRSAVSPDLNFSEASGQLLAETRATFARLEKEAEELELAYQQFQQRITETPPQSHRLPSATQESNVSSPPRLSNRSGISLPKPHPPTYSSLTPLLSTTTKHSSVVWSPSAPHMTTSVKPEERPHLATPNALVQPLGLPSSSAPISHLSELSPPLVAPMLTGAQYSPVTSVQSQTSQPTLPIGPHPLLSDIAVSLQPPSVLTSIPHSHVTPQMPPLYTRSLSVTTPSRLLPSASPNQSLSLVTTITPPPFLSHYIPPSVSVPSDISAPPPTLAVPDTTLHSAGRGSAALPSALQGPLATAPLIHHSVGAGVEGTTIAKIAQTQPGHLQQRAPEIMDGNDSGSVTAVPSSVTAISVTTATCTSRPVSVAYSIGGHRSAPVTKMSLDNLWKSPSSAVRVSESQPPETTPPVSDATPGELTLTQGAGGTKPELSTNLGEHAQTSGQRDPLDSSWERGRRQRMEEQARRQREEEERVRRELKELEKEEERQHVTTLSPTRIRTEVSTSDGLSTVPFQGKCVDQQGGGEEVEEEEGEGRTDSVMRKYMEIVSQRREQRKGATTATSDDKLTGSHQEDVGEKDYNLMFSHVSESNEGFSDGDRDPFEDW